eukprot:scpid105187/ scgid17596/ 
MSFPTTFVLLAALCRLSLYSELCLAQTSIPQDTESGDQACGQPMAPTNGQVSPGTFNTADVLTFSCDMGYYLSGPSEVTCQPDGTATDTSQTACNSCTFSKANVDSITTSGTVTCSS